jgi:DNA-directed RNA polymerase subunit RPC12/RpoP
MPFKDPKRNQAAILRWRSNNKAKVSTYQRKYQYKRRYGITLEQRDQLLRKQRYRCAGCGTKTPGKRGWMVDHCHTKKHIRGILCSHCNLTLGHAKDRPRVLRKLANYLESNK